MELLELLRILGRYKWLIAVLASSAVVNAVLLTYVVTEKYESTAVVLVRPQEDLNISSIRSDKEALSFPLSQLVPFEATATTYGEVIRSRAVVERTVSLLGLDQKEEPSEWWKRWKRKIKSYLLDLWTYMKYGRLEETDPFGDAVELVQESLTVEPTKDAYIFEITCQSSEAAVAAAVVNTIADIFVTYNRELYKTETGTARAFVETQLNESEKDLAKVRDELQRFKEKYSIVSLDQEVESKVKALLEFESKLELAQRDVAAKRAEVSSLRKQVRGDRAGATLSGNVREQLMSELVLAEVALESLQEGQANLEKTVKQWRLQLEELPWQQRQVAQLELEVNIAADTHQLVKKALAEARIHEAEKIQEIHVISSGSVPTYPIRPIKVYYAGVSLSLALVVGVAVALLFEYLNFTIRTVEQAENALDLPLLATFPLMRS